LEWAPKYRFNLFGKESSRRDCEAILLGIAEGIDIDVLELAVMPDHVHMIVRSGKPEHPSRLLQYLKGKSAYLLFRKHPNMRKRYPKGHLWSRGSFVRNIGVDIEVERRYVRMQGDIHQRKLTDYAT